MRTGYEIRYKIVFTQDGPGRDRLFAAYEVFRILYPLHAKGYDKLRMMNQMGEELERISWQTSQSRCEVCGRVGEEEERALLVQKDDFILLWTQPQRDEFLAMATSDRVAWKRSIGPKIQDLIEWSREWPKVEVDIHEKSE